jgi:hypothetical protein
MTASKKTLLATTAASPPKKSIPSETASETLRRQRKAAVQPAAQSAARNDRRNGDRDGGDDDDGDGERGRHHKPQLANRIDEVLASPEAEGGDDDLITTLGLANWFNVSAQWVELGRTKNYGPPFVRLGPQVVRYRRGTVKAWLAERQHTCTTEYTKRAAKEVVA